MLDILEGEDLCERCLECREFTEVAEILDLVPLDLAVLVFLEDQQVEHSNGARFDERRQLLRHLAGEVLCAGGELHDDVVDRSQLFVGDFAHRMIGRGLAMLSAERQTADRVRKIGRAHV